MSSKNKNINYSNVIFFLLILTCLLAKAEEENKNYRLKILEYLSNNKEFSSTFIQYSDDAFQEGEFFLKKKQVENRV